MEQLDDYSLLLLLEQTHPSQYLSIYRTGSTRLRYFLIANKYRLLAIWCDTDLNVTELEEYLPNLTLQQLAVIANYFYPEPVSINNYPQEQLFYNACKAGYTVEDCLRYTTGNSMLDSTKVSVAYNILSAYITGRDDVLNSTQFKDNQFTQSLLTKSQLTDDIDIALLHPNISISQFCDLLYEFYKVNNNDPYLNTILDAMTAEDVDETSNSPYPLLGNSNDKSVMDLLDRTGRTRGLSTAQLSEYHLSYYVGITSKCNLINRLQTTNGYDLNGRIQLENYLSQYDSKKYPSYDLVADIACGNWLEVIHKANTYDRIIRLSVINESSYIVSPPKYLQPVFTKLYKQTVRETFGNVLLNRHPVESSMLVNINGFAPEDSIPLLQKWCFPNKDLSRVSQKMAKNYMLLSEYYHPYPIASDSWDISILLENRLDQSFEDIQLLILSQVISPIVKYNCAVILHYNNKDEWIDRLGLDDIFGEELLDLVSNELHMIVNHTYLTLDEKYDVLSRCTTIDDDILQGLCGDKGQSSGQLIGMIFNAYLPEDRVIPLVEESGYNYIRKLTPQDIVLAARKNIINLRTGKSVPYDFPLQLIWQVTDIFRVSDSYTNDVFTLTSKAPYNKESASALYIGNQQYYEWVTEEARGSPANIGNMGSKYGYTIRFDE